MPRPHPCLAPPPAPIAPHHLSTAPLPLAPIGLASSTSRPPRAAARVPLSRCVGPGPLAGKNRTVCIPFSPNARERPPSWQHPPEMHAFRDQDGNILALCIHFRAQSGDSGYMARESCRQGPTFASRNPKSRMARRCCQRRTGFAVRDPPRGPRTDASRYLRAAPIPPAARTHRVQEASGTTQTTQCGHKNRIPKWGPY